jgi:hypothetical protein
MMKLIALFSLCFFHSIAFAENNLLMIDPFSAESISRQFPHAVRTRRVINDEGYKYFKKNIAPLTQEVTEIEYNKLIPHLIALVKEQQKEIERLKEK